MSTEYFLLPPHGQKKHPPPTPTTTTTNMLSRLQRTKGYFFAICVILSIIVCILSWQLFRQSPHLPMRETDHLVEMSADHGAARAAKASGAATDDQISKLHKSLHEEPLLTSSLENYLRIIHNKTQRTIMRNLANQQRRRQDPVPRDRHDGVRHTTAGGTRSERGEGHGRRSGGGADNNEQGILLGGRSRHLDINANNARINTNTNTNNSNNNNNSSRGINTKQQHRKSVGRRNSSSFDAVVVGNNDNNNNRDNSNNNAKPQFPLPNRARRLDSTNNNNHNNNNNNNYHNNNNTLLLSSEKFRQSLNHLKKLKDQVNTLRVSSKQPQQPQKQPPQQQKQPQKQKFNKVTGTFVEDIHNFHAPVERKKARVVTSGGGGRNNLEDALSRAAMDPPDHILTGKLCEDCVSSGFQYDLNVEDICHTGGGGAAGGSDEDNDELRLVILVESPPSNEDSRNAIRKTWGAVSQVGSSGVRVVFLLGKSRNPLENQLAEQEYWLNQDIVQIDFVDAYANLTYKTLSGLHWVNTFCPNAKYVMKTDDDMYVNTPLIAKMLLASPRTKFLGGYCWGASTPHRDSSSKWYVPYDMYPSATFPPMCSGTGYIMSRDLVKDIINVSLQVGFFYLEDVYVSLCLQSFDVYPVNILGFSNMLVSFDSCLFRNAVLTSHGHTPYDLQTEWPQVLSCIPKDLTPHQLFMPIPYPEVD